MLRIKEVDQQMIMYLESLGTYKNDQFKVLLNYFV